ncbi:MAG TPA: aminoglycoside 6'-N-acetyltransferase [Gemmatimonadaceae bacterium]|nr:aminoglycoside 6'-N-acetyltransferase [Gemmatimonadaceae bacterium]
MRVRLLEPSDWNEWRRMRAALWPDEPTASTDPDMRAWHGRADARVFVAERADGSLCGFIEVGTRPYAEGCETSPVGFIEGWYVDPDVRRHGCGRALIEAAEEWARSAGYTEMGSDALLDNLVSHRAHERLGYTEVERLVAFRKSLTSRPADTSP